MPSHMSSIGFRVETRESFSDLLAQVVPQSRRVPVADGSYLLWTGGGGEELWLQIDAAGEGLGMSPHFVGQSAVPVAITERVRRHDQTLLDGAFHCWANPPEGRSDDGDYPFVFDCPNARTYQDLTLPHRGVVQVAAFAHEVTCFPSLSAFERTRSTTELSLGSKSVIPVGLFSRSGGPTLPPTADVILTGHVLQTKVMRNGFTGDEFMWALVETFGGSYDVVIDSRLIEEPVSQGGVVSGT
jgi:hypothetical protein